MKQYTSRAKNGHTGVKVHVVEGVIQALSWTEVLHKDNFTETLGRGDDIIKLEGGLDDIETGSGDNGAFRMIVSIRERNDDIREQRVEFRIHFTGAGAHFVRADFFGEKVPHSVLVGHGEVGEDESRDDAHVERLSHPLYALETRADGVTGVGRNGVTVCQNFPTDEALEFSGLYVLDHQIVTAVPERYLVIHT